MESFDDVGCSSPKSPKVDEFYLNFKNDSCMADFVDHQNFLHLPSQSPCSPCSQPSQPSQSNQTQSINEEPTEDGEENNAFTSHDTKIVPVFDGQPDPVSWLSPATPHFYCNDMGFQSRDEARNWVKARGLEVMCSMVRNGLSNDNRFELICEQGGEYVSHKKKGYEYPKKTTKVYKTKTRKRGCPFKILFKLAEDKLWNFKVVEGRHNHEDPKSFIGHSLVAKLKPDEMEDVERWTLKTCTAPMQILNNLRANNLNIVSCVSTIYSARATIQRKTWDGKSVMQEFQRLAHDHDYTYKCRLGPDGKEVLQIFLAHPKMVKLAQCFFPMLMMDCTYKTNTYHMPLFNIVGQTSGKAIFTVAWCFMRNETKDCYVWALEHLKLIYRANQLPREIVTDNDSTLVNAISMVFPKAKNFLCTFHFATNVETNRRHHIQPPKNSKKSSKKGDTSPSEEDVRISQLSLEEQGKLKAEERESELTKKTKITTK